MPPCRLTDLPAELRLTCVRGLPAEDLAAASATCSTLNDDISADDASWRLCCLPYFTAAPSAISPSAKVCYSTANGWARISSVPRTTVSAATPSSGRGSRTRTHNLAQISAWDACDDDCLLFSTVPSVGQLPTLSVVHFDAEQGQEQRRQTFEMPCAPSTADEPIGSGRSARQVQDIVRLPMSSAQPERALTLCHHHGTRVAVHALKSTTAGGDELQVVPLWTLSDAVAFDGMPGFLPHRLAWQRSTGTSAETWTDGAADVPAPPVGQLVAWGWTRACVCDVRTGQVVTRRAPPVAERMIDLCFPDPSNPHLIAMAAQGGPYEHGKIVLHDLRVDGGAQLSITTPHHLICRLRPGPDPLVLLSSHKICKDIEQWDLRRPQLQPGRAFAHCAGNAPDFEYAQSTLVCFSRGSPGTTFGAKLQVFADRPCKISNTAGAILPEIVIDTFNRHSYARSLRLGTRTLTVLADGERLIRCSMPTLGQR